MKNLKEIITNNKMIIILIITIYFMVYLTSVVTIQKIKCPQMTSIEILLVTNDLILLKFKQCIDKGISMQEISIELNNEWNNIVLTLAK